MSGTCVVFIATGTYTDMGPRTLQRRRSSKVAGAGAVAAAGGVSFHEMTPSIIPSYHTASLGRDPSSSCFALRRGTKQVPLNLSNMGDGWYRDHGINAKNN